MKTFKVEFAVNGKVNKHGFYVDAMSFGSAASKAFLTLHKILDGVASVEILSVSLEK